MSEERQFVVTAHFKKRSIIAGTFTAASPIDAIIAAKEKQGFFSATTLNCDEHQLSWEAEEDFI